MTGEIATVYVVDDDSAMRDSIEFLVSSVGYQCQSYASAEAFLEVFKAGEAACLVLDVRMPKMGGLELQRVLAGQGATLGLVFVTGHGDIPMAVTAMRGGAVDFLEKPFNDQRLLDCINEALRYSMRMTNAAKCRAAVVTRLAQLTARERDVLDLVMAGKPNKVIALTLDLSVKTVEVHRSKVMEKMAVMSVAELACCVNLAK
ncbi:MAG: response regulator [Gallionellaceae bacterium]|jgi:FixJ family two-component response regulator